MESLYDTYLAERDITISRDQFALFVEFFPALMVMLSDGVIDEQEKMYLERLQYSLANIFKEDGLSSQQVQDLGISFGEEFNYLIHNLADWQEPYLEALSSHLDQYPESKSLILDTLHLFAENSEDFAEEENRMIDFLANRLNLSSGES